VKKGNKTKIRSKEVYDINNNFLEEFHTKKDK